MKSVPKFGVSEIVQFVGLKSLSSEEQEVLYRLSLEYLDKVRRSVQGPISTLVVHVKKYNSAGKRKKFSLHVRCIVASKEIFESCKSHDWDLPRALHKSFEDLRQQIAHKLRTDVTRPKTYG